MYRAVIFDFEGTLVNFAWDKENAVREVRELLMSNGVSANGSYAELYNFVAANHPDLKSDVDMIYDRYDLMASRVWKLKNEVPQVLSSISAVKAVVSNVGGGLLRKLLNDYGIMNYFYTVTGRRDVRMLKPSDEGLRCTLEKMNVCSDETLFVGDSVSDVLACRKTGMDVAVVEGESSFEELDADYKLSSLSDILSLPIQGL